MNASPANNARSGNASAIQRLRNTAPENRAIAPTGARFQGCGAMRSAAARQIIARADAVFKSASSLMLNFMVFLLKQIAIGKTVARYHFALPELHRRAEDGPIEHKRVKLTVFAARVHARRKFANKTLVQFSTYDALRQDLA